MALTICNECGKEVATTAEACPNCGNPINPVREKTTKTVVTPTPENKSSVPPWVVFPAIIIGALLLFLLYMVFSGGKENANTNLDVNVTRDDAAVSTTKTTPQKTTDTTIVQTDTDVPPVTNEAPTPINEQNVSPDTKTQVIEDKETPDKGKVSLDAKFADKDGKVKPVKEEKFYLLDKDLETILREAKLQPIDGQSLKNSFGLSVVSPDKYNDFQQKALNAINDHVKYDLLTNAEGKADFTGVEPKSYYLFGIHKVGNGFAIWDSAITVNKGENKLNLQPTRTTEIK